MRTTLLLAFAVPLLIISCKKDKSHPDKECHCNDAPLIFYKDSTMVAFPNAFTPNHDGKNDGFTAAVAKGIREGSSHLTVYNCTDQVVYETDTLTKPWFGTDIDGHERSASYHYKVSFVTTRGRLIDTSGCVRAFAFSSDSCLIIEAKSYIFQDQFDPVSGYHGYMTSEDFCE